VTENPDRLGEIARSLNRCWWLPTVEEVEFGGAFFRLRRGVEEDPDSGFPRGLASWNCLRTEVFTALARTVRAVQEDLLPSWRHRLDGSPMVELVDLYVSAGRPILPHAEQLMAAWRDVSLPEPSAEEIAYEARRLNVTPEEGEVNLRFFNAHRWEQATVPRSLWDGLLPVSARLGAIQSTMMAAVTGDTEY
jgi:hypothetical protein